MKQFTLAILILILIPWNAVGSELHPDVAECLVTAEEEYESCVNGWMAWILGTEHCVEAKDELEAMCYRLDD